ncbi:hypothetical protein Pint_19723 [Pistacia integerrima]|uniref:Uncharacterized protein n=1 Tax=Pistacia integerrima TaxID=434235 RepID=A0ACC0X8L0_9ROSI|nr:hypothetical protein Pint_19723 [Pistacia integerrima]
MAATSYKKYSNDSCRDVVDSTKLKQSSHFSYFFSMNISQPRVRVKIPKVVLKTMQRRSTREDESFKDANDNGDDDDGKIKKRVAPKKLLPVKVGRVFLDFFRRKKSSKEERSCSANGENRRVCRKNVFDLADEKETERLKKVETEEMGLLQLSFKSLLKKRNGGGVKVTKANTSGGVDTTSGGSNNRTAVVIGRQESSLSLPRVPSRIMTTRQRLKMARSMRKKPVKMGSGETDQEDGERSGQELCKKRILLGGKCRPLNHSGTLQYDKDGVLLPEIIP